MIKLSRSQMNKVNPYTINIDITVKSSKGIWRQLAPTWDMVHGYKQNNISDIQYTEQYHKILAKADIPGMVKIMKETVVDDYLMGKDQIRVNFWCYCRDDQFCHTNLLIDYLIDLYPETFVR